MIFHLQRRSACLRHSNKLVLALCCCLHMASATAAAAVWLSETQLRNLRQPTQRATGLLRRCDQEIGTPPSPVASFAPPAHYTKTGVEMTEVSKAFFRDAGLAYRAALCFAISQKAAYARYAQGVISAWADTLKSVDSKQGGSEINFIIPQFILAASLVRDAHDWDDRNFQAMLQHIALPHSHSAQKNNHANWGVLLNTAIAAYLDDAELLTQARLRWLELIDQQVDADGVLTREICRSDTNDYCGGTRKGINGLSYTHYTLLPTTAAAQIFAVRGLPVWKSAQGNKLAAAYHKAANWTLHPETFPYYASNAGQLNGVRNAAYFALLQQHYPNADAAAVLASGKLGMNGLEWGLLFN